MSTPQQNVQSLVRLMGVLLLLISVSGATASAQDQLSAQNIIRIVIRIEDHHAWQELAQYWTTEEQPTLTAFLEDEQNKSNGIGYFNIQSAKLVEIKELPLESAKPFVDVDKYIEQYGSAKVFYVGIDYTVRQESKYYYNGGKLPLGNTYSSG